MGSSSTKEVYANGRPTFKDATKVHPMFNGMLFRLSDTKNSRWAFYNDSKDYVIHVTILFDYDSQIVPLGSTNAFRIDDPDEGREDDMGKYVAEVDVMPLATEMFIEGKVTGWAVDTLEARTEVDEQGYRL